MVVYAYFPDDERLRREADALVKAGYSISILCLKLPNELKTETVFEVKVYRLSMSSKRANKSKYIFLYASFFFRAFFRLNLLYLKEKYNVIHVHNMPDFLVFLGFIPKMFGAKIILDLHDPSPEIFMTKFSDGEDRLISKLLKWLEKISIKFSHSVITTNKSFLDRFVSRGCPEEKINIVMNTPQESVFNKFAGKKRKKFDEKKFIVMYHGSIVKRHGLDLLAKSAKILENKIPELEVIVYGDGEFVPEFLAAVKSLNIENIVKYFGKVSLDEIAETIPEINLGVIPNRIGPFTQINLPVRTFEYLCMNKPVVVPRTQGIKDYFPEDSIFYFNAGDDVDLANVIYSCFSNPEKLKEIMYKGFEIYFKYRWENQGKELIKIYSELLS
jgi:glycosyltransferase involved in cell wall biosynthesis